MKNSDRKNNFIQGFRDGIPIGLGYFVVSFSLGIIAKQCGLKFYQGFLASFLNHASAGEYVLYTAMGSAATFLEVALVTFIANARYLLLSSALSQKYDEHVPFIHRAFSGFMITDEIFGISIAREGILNPWYVYGAFFCACPMWSLGTAIGIIAGNILPVRIICALSVALYGMFLAIIFPPAKKSRTIAVCIGVSFILSFLFSRVELLSKTSSGNRVIILTVLIAGVAALVKPVKDECQE